MSEQKKNQPRTDDLKQGPDAPGGKQTPTGGEGEMRPARATGRTRPHEQDMEPAHPPGTVGHTIPQSEYPDPLGGGSDEIHDGEMGGSSRAVRITNPNNKNRAA